MFNWFRQFSVASRLRAMALLAVAGVIGVACTLMWSSYKQQLADRQTSVKQAVEVAYSTIQWVHARQEAGELNELQAQKMALAALDKLRYGGNEYFWVNDMGARMVHHPIKPQLDGQDVANMKAPNGVYLFKAFVDMVRTQGQGFVNYQWPKPGMAAPQDKVSYVKGFAPWGWVLGSGLYLDDVQAAFRAQAFTAIGLVLVTALIWWGLIEITARDLRVRTEQASFKKMASLNHEIAHATTTERAQQSAALIEESAAAAGSLKDQADTMAQVVSRFRVAGAF